MARPAARIAFVQFGFFLAFAAVVARAVQVQVFQQDQWEREAARTRTEHQVVPARRGAILDRNGVSLATTNEVYHIGIAPNELRDETVVRRLLTRDLGIPAARVRQDFRKGRSWIYYHGPFTADQIADLRMQNGVHPDPVYSRTYQNLDLAAPIIGRVTSDSGIGRSGLELSLDSILTGRPGERVVLKDARGREYPSPSREIRDPVPGADVYLTLDSELQEIAEASLASALEEYDAAAGDIVMVDPATGEILAMASRRRDGTARPSALTDTYEPGSTAKLFTAAALLAHDRIDSTTMVFGEHGRWLMPLNRDSTRTRRIEDTHAAKGYLTLAEAVEVSSNIAMGKFSHMLSYEEQYDQLRDFGFGSPTGVEYPSESRGLLRPPDRWDAYTQASLAMGYEFSVTPVQLAAAYGAIANDGILLNPALVREIRAPDGSILYRHQPEPVRRAVTGDVAARLRSYLASAAGEEGTGARAQLENFRILGKTGTAKKLLNGRYTADYTASFASIFPAEDPQLVTVVKLDSPAGRYYASETAAPVTHDLLKQAMASSHVALDRSRIGTRPATAVAPRVEPERPEPAPVAAVAWPLEPDTAERGLRLAVPDVEGKTVRQAALLLHRRGFRVALHGLGMVRRMSPGAGDSLRTGATVTLWASGGR